MSRGNNKCWEFTTAVNLEDGNMQEKSHVSISIEQNSFILAMIFKEIFRFGCDCKPKLNPNDLCLFGRLFVLQVVVNSMVTTCKKDEKSIPLTQVVFNGVNGLHCLWKRYLLNVS